MQILIISDDTENAKLWKKELSIIDEKAQLFLVNKKNATDFLKDNDHPDIIFIEAEKEKDLYISAEADCSSPLVVISENAELCLSAFSLNTFNYLIKPLAAEDFEQSLEKFNKFYNKKIDKDFLGDLHSLVKFVSKKEKDYKKRFMVKIGNTIKSIQVKDIAYFFSQDKITYLMKHDGKKFPIENTLDEAEEILNPENFYRANRQFIININAISEIHPYFKGRVKLNLVPIQETDIIISSDKSRSFKDWLNK